MEIKTVTETQHQELLKLLNPLIEFMAKNDYNYFLVIGKDGICTRHMKGQTDDVIGMMTGMAENNKQVRFMLSEVDDNLNNKTTEGQ